MLEKRKKTIIANWKMKLSHQASLALAEELVKKYEPRDDLEVVICPDQTALDGVGQILKGSQLKLGAQDIFYHNVGSYTGQVSPAVVKELGAEYALIGHSEKRHLGETDEIVNRKVQAALKNKLTPVICVGETFEEYQGKKTDVVIITQVTKALEDIKLEKGQRFILAYEPIWVIGSGQAVDHSIVEHIVQIILHTAIDINPQLADKFDVIYGGSVNSENVNDFIIGNLSTGVIIGAQSLKVDNFLKIIDRI